MTDEYPSESDLQKIGQLACDYKRTDELLDFLKSIWWQPEWGFKLYFGRDFVHKKKCRKLELHTGGWSGNEEIINVLEGSMFWIFYWEKSIRGGHYWFEIKPIIGFSK